MSPKFEPIGSQTRSRPASARHVAEPAALVAVEARALAAGRPAELAPDDLGERRPGAGDEEVEPAVVVVVPEPAGEAVVRLGDAEPLGDVGERAVAVVVVEPIGLAQVRDVQVGPAVVVVVAPGDALAEAVVARPRPTRRRR